MKTILQITNDRVDSRQWMQQMQPAEMLIRKIDEIAKEGKRAQADPSCVILASHFANDLARQLNDMGCGVRFSEGIIQGLATSVICTAIREWESINAEFDQGLTGQKMLS